ncbi:KIN14E [Symbiodinium sp. CCMP2592]|nr:KIN14E [Symbiodinium sp. CCMP2592]
MAFRLHISATSSTDLCEVLVSSRADITARTADQDTPLHFANCFQQLDTIELLLKAGADASAANNFGVVPLHVAVAYAGLERLELREAKATLLLCAYGAKLDARDHHGHTPAAVARMAGAHSSLIDFLESASEDHQATAQDLLNAVDEDAEDFASSSLALKAMQSEKTAGSDGWAPPSPSVARARANSYAGQDMQLTEENSRLSQETKRLQKELDEARANIRHLQGLLDQSRSTMERLKSTRLSVSEAPGAEAKQSEALGAEFGLRVCVFSEAFQAVRDDMEKEKPLRSCILLSQRIFLSLLEGDGRAPAAARGSGLRPECYQMTMRVYLRSGHELDQESTDVRLVLASRETFTAEAEIGIAGCRTVGTLEPEFARKVASSSAQERESLLRQLEEAAEKQERAEATVKRITAERNEALERPAVKDISRPSSAVTRQAAEQAATQDAALFAKEEALSQKDAELQAKAQAEQEALEALQAKDAELERLTAELHAMKSQADRSGKDLEERSAELSQKEADVLSRKAEVQRLNGELERQATEKEELWKNLTELRAQHKELREQQSKTSQELGAVQTQLQEREVELEGQLKEKDQTKQAGRGCCTGRGPSSHLQELTIQKLEEDATQLTGQAKPFAEHVAATSCDGVSGGGGAQRRAGAGRAGGEDARHSGALAAQPLPGGRHAVSSPRLEPWKKRTEEVHEAFQKEQALRKRYHNQMQDMKGAIRVFARIRPKVSREADQEISVWRRDAFSLECAAKDKKSTAKDYNFDAVFDEHNSQEDVFADCRGLIGSAVDGFNVTVFAYGQTGAGKTHTMCPNLSSQLPLAASTFLTFVAILCPQKAMPGLVPRAAEELFTVLRRYAHECESKVLCSMFELYRDDLVDLLFTKAKGKAPPVLDIKKDPRGTVKVENAVEIEVTNPDELQKTISTGMDRRHVAATKMNADSSRCGSHEGETVLWHVQSSEIRCF